MTNKTLARDITTRGIASGRLTRPDKCVDCGRTASIEAHHIDYNDPDKIIWLCSPCHRKAHGATNVYIPLPSKREKINFTDLTELEKHKKIKSLNAQFRHGTLERNTEIFLRALGGEPQIALANEFGITKQAVNQIIKRRSNA